MTGRNDPCPCGSGRKYKKCCADRSAVGTRSAFAPDIEAVYALFHKHDYPGAVQLAEQLIREGWRQAELFDLLGIAYYQLGQREKAREALSCLLECRPDNPDAHNNLSLLLNEMGDWQAAIAHAKRAISLQPRLASAYNNLGNAFKAGHSLKEARECFAKAIELGYRHPGVYTNLGVTEQSLYCWTEAEEAYRRAISLDPEYFPALNNMAVILQKLKRYEEAKQYFERALNINNHDIELQVNYASFYHVQKQYQVAKGILLSLLEIHPNCIGAHVNLGLICEQEGKISEAIERYEIALSYDPENANANYNLAALLQHQGETRRAHQAYLTAIKSDPNMAVAYAGLAMLLLETDQRVEAEKYFEIANALNPGDIHILTSKCEFLIAHQQYSEAISLLEGLLLEDANDTGVYEKLIKVHELLGDYESATKRFHELLESNPDNYYYKLNLAAFEEKFHKLENAHKLIFEIHEKGIVDQDADILLARIYRRQGSLEAALTMLEKFSEQTPVVKRTLKNYLFEYANVLDKLGRYSEAFDSFVAANKVKNEIIQTTYDPETIKSNIGRIEEMFKPGWQKHLPAFKPVTDIQAQVPIFIVGFPRSGTTLLEQILSSHPEVVAGGELIFIQDIVRGKADRSLGCNKSYPELLYDENGYIKQSALEKLRNYYLASVKKLNLQNMGARFFTDKMPLNLLELGLISLIFPESPIIHIIRHPLDVCFSSFSSDFEKGNRFTSSLESTAQLYADALGTTRYYKSVLDMKYLEVRYEDVILDQESQTRRVLEFIGLPWHDDCLKFYRNKRIANTASYAQVTQKLYNSSMYRYKHYFHQLQPLVPILQQEIDYFGYSVEP